MFDRLFILFLQVHGSLESKSKERVHGSLESSNGSLESGHGCKAKDRVHGSLESCNHIALELTGLWSFVYCCDLLSVVFVECSSVDVVIYS